MKDRGAEYAYLIPEKGVSLWMQTYLRYIPFSYLIVPVFLYLFFGFLSIFYSMLKVRSENFNKVLDIFDSNNLFKIYLSLCAFIFMLLPILISSGEPRYRLQFLPYMLLFIASCLPCKDID
jgi:hypothetical protein